jgi:hypothetical protein
MNELFAKRFIGCGARLPVIHLPISACT